MKGRPAPWANGARPGIVSSEGDSPENVASGPGSQASRAIRAPGPYPYSEAELADGFASRYGGADFVYAATLGGWFRRSTNDNGQPCWEPDEKGEVNCGIIEFLLKVNRNLEGSSFKPNLEICSAKTVRAVEELARFHPSFARTEADLSPVKLAEAAAAFWLQNAQAAQGIEYPEQPLEEPIQAPRRPPSKLAKKGKKPKRFTDYSQRSDVYASITRPPAGS
jgi:hypothetical protein